MTRAQLEHVMRAAGTIANVDDVVVIGSQEILGGFPDAPAEFLVSDEADVFPCEHIERTDPIDSTIRKGSWEEGEACFWLSTLSTARISTALPPVAFRRWPSPSSWRPLKMLSHFEKARLLVISTVPRS
jgi:hypothetical protein